jgi:hypothetical protein
MLVLCKLGVERILDLRDGGGLSRLQSAVLD